MSAVCRASPMPSTTPSSSWARPISRCRTTTGAPGWRRTSSACISERAGRTDGRGATAAARQRAYMKDMSLSRENISDRLAAAGYIADRDIATALWLMDYLKRPLLLEGEAGVGKTEGAKGAPAV